MRARPIHFVSLGCPKNRVDSEVMLGVAEQAGYTHVADADKAEVIVINTCGFIDQAKQESINTILELGQLKETGRCKKLVVTGCLSQRYATEMAPELPEVDHFLGSSDMLKLGLVLKGDAPRLAVGNPADWVMTASDPRTRSTRGASAYLKIAEGCNRSCSFCVIPEIRGKQRSRSLGDIVAEAQALASRGVLELNLVSQDTVAYGRDLPGDARKTDPLSELLIALGEVQGIQWLRLHYLYPERLSPALLDLLRNHPKLLPYVDMPLQHAARDMLRRMRRGGRTDLLRVVEELREQVPHLVFRSAFIVGHPGETEGEFEELCQFVQSAELDHVGVFQYSDEESAASHALADKVPAAVAEARAERLLGLQRPISRRRNEALIGKNLQILVEGPSEESELVMVGRHAGQAPEVDGQVFLSDGLVTPGTFCKARVVSVTDYDLLAEVEELDEPRESEGPTSPGSESPGSLPPAPSSPRPRSGSKDGSGRRKIRLPTV